MTSKQIKRLQDESRERFRLAKRRLQSAAGTENGYTSRNKGFTDRSSYTSGGLARGDRPMFEGEFNVRAGQDPTDAEVMAYIEATGGDPAGKKLKAMMERSKSDKSREALRQRLQGQASTTQGSSIVDQMISSAKSAVDEANAANDARYSEVKGSNEALYGRVMDKVGDWGGVQSKLNEERAAESLSNQKAYLASRGLANSNVLPAFQARNDRDLALTQQDLSERKSAREIAYDVDLTNNSNAFIERRNDIAPDMAPYYQIAMEYAKSGAGQLPVEATTGKKKLKRRGGNVNPLNSLLASRRGLQLQQQVGNAYGAVPMYRSYGGGPAYTSNRYPTRRSPEEYAAVDAQRGGGRQLLPTYQQPMPALQLPGGPPQGMGPYYA